MAEYINLEKLIALKNNVEYMCYDLYDLEDFLADVKKECSADVVEVVHGEWVKKTIPFECDFETGLISFIDINKCSVCGCEIPKNYFGECLVLSSDYKFCPNCGADMRGDKNG